MNKELEDFKKAMKDEEERCDRCGNEIIYVFRQSITVFILQRSTHKRFHLSRATQDHPESTDAEIRATISHSTQNRGRIL